MIYNYVAPCLFGLESVLSGELKRMGALDVKSDNGKVYFSGEANILARANLCCRTAERILILLGSFTATTFEMLFEGVKAIPFYEFIGANDTFPVKGWAVNSQLMSVPDCQSIIKKAIVKSMTKHYNQEWFYETGPTYQIQFSIHKDEVNIMLDTSGPGLHKRGYRENANEAPIKETLAAGILDLAFVKRDSIVYDPMCGSGTFVIESALKALNIPPCINRKFAAQKFSFIDQNIFSEERAKAIELIRQDAKFFAYGGDINNDSVNLTKSNAKKGGVFSRVLISNNDITNFAPKTETGIVFCNPPYGERMLDKKSAEDIYIKMGKVFDKKPGFSYYIITPDENFENLFGRRAVKKRKLYNGMLKCNLYMYF